MKIKEVSEKLFLQNRRGQNIFFSLLIRRGPNPEGSCSHETGGGGGGGVPNPEGSYIYQLRGVRNRRGLNFANPEGSYFCQSGWVLFLPIRKGTVFVNPEGYYFA